MTSQAKDFNTGAALVVGGSGGIGAAICQALAAAGSNVVLTYRSNAAKAQEIERSIKAGGCDAAALALDLTDATSIRKVVATAIERFGHLHSVVYAAGPSIRYLYINEITHTEWARVMDADVNGFFNLVEATLPHLRERRSGSYLAIVTAAVDRAPPRDILSAAPKAAIEMLVRGIAREEGRNGIRANCVGPGLIAAGLGVATVNEHTHDYVERMTKAVPLKRAGTAEEVADVSVFLLSGQASYVTGVTIPVAGGLQLA